MGKRNKIWKVACSRGIFSAVKRKFGENLAEILGSLYAAIVALIVEKFENWKQKWL